jgi:biotin transport system substrate-specific component
MSTATLAPSSALDRLRSDDLPLATQAALVAGAAVLTGILAQFEMRIYLWEVPLTLQTLAVYGSGLFLGWRNGALAMLLYLALGLVLPFYAGGASGVAHLLGASGGYLGGFVLASFVAGWVTATDRGLVRTALGLAAASVVLFACGVGVLHVVAGHATWTESVVTGWLRFVPWDLAKLGVVGGTYLAARRVGL